MNERRTERTALLTVRRTDARAGGEGTERVPVSVHVLDLAPRDASPRRRGERLRAPAPKGFIARFRHLLDERIHLQDMRVRTLSVRPRGWKDFPPTSATTLVQAVGMTVSRFFREHPLADLTVLTLLHMLAVIVWHVAVRPFASDGGADEDDAGIRTAPAFPLAAVSAVAAATVPAAMPAMRRTRPLAPAPAPVASAAPEPVPGRMFRLRLPTLAIARPPDWQKSVVGFAVVALLLILPFGAYSSLGTLSAVKEESLGRGMEAIDLLKAAGDAARAQDFVGASKAFAAAAEDLEGIRDRLGAVGSALGAAASLLPVNAPFVAAGPLLDAGRGVAEAGSVLTAGLAGLDGADDPVAKLRVLESTLATAAPHIELASRSLAKVSPEAVPDRYRDLVIAAKSELPRFSDGVGQAVGISRTLQAILGADEQKRYLVVFQNNAELRPTGGFIGSFALVDVRNGEVRKMEIPGGGSYDLKGALLARVRSPQPLHLINPHWQFQDANWFPDFPTSAEKLVWFYEKSGGPTVDGVIAVNASLMEEILDAIGPVEMPEYEKTITAQNFYYETQKQVEIDYDKEENKPKQFIADLAPKVLQRVVDADRGSYLRLAGILDRAMKRKDLQLWARDAELQREIAGHGWAGEMKAADGDYLAVVHTNIAGQKTDLVMREDIRHHAKVLPDGSAIATLTIARTHSGQKGALFSGVRNVDYLRVYVPRGSVLVEARGFEPPDPKLFKIADPEFVSDPAVAGMETNARTDRDSGTRTTQEGDKTVFGNWVQTDPGEKSVVTLVYRLPPGIVSVKEGVDGRLAALYDRLVNGAPARTLEYSLLVQKQSGANPATFTSSVDFPRGYRAVWQRPDRQVDEWGALTATRTIDGDAFFGVLAELR